MAGALPQHNPLLAQGEPQQGWNQAGSCGQTMVMAVTSALRRQRARDAPEGASG